MSQQEIETPYRQARLPEFQKLKDSGYEVVDVREDWEWNRGHIPGARHIVLSSILANPRGHRFVDQTVFVCESGERSAVAAEMAVALGTKDVVNFVGGTREWRKSGLPLEKPGEQQPQ